MSKTLIVVLALTALFMVVEAVAGYVSGSLALLADAGHMLIDVGALGLTAFTAWLARKPASPKKRLQQQLIFQNKNILTMVF